MSDIEDKLLEFEEKNWNELAEKFIQKHQFEWMEFIEKKYFESKPDYEPDYDPNKDL